MLLKIMQLYLPEFVKKKKLVELFRLTAGAFQSELPELKGLSFPEILARYALFTREQAEIYWRNGCHLEEIQRRLYHNACIFGRSLRKSLRITTWEEAVTALAFIYRLIGIDFQCDRQGEVTIRQCFFSNYYSSEI